MGSLLKKEVLVKVTQAKTLRITQVGNLLFDY